MSQDNAISKSILSVEWFKEKSAELSDHDDKVRVFYDSFRAKFSPEKLALLKGKEILTTIFLNPDNKTNMCYELEFDDNLRRFFGSIKSGTAYKYGLHYSKKNQTWATGTGMKPFFISEDEAIVVGTKLRDCLIAGAEILKDKKSLDSLEDFNAIYDTLLKATDGYINRVWCLKYYHLIFPDLYPPIYSESAQRTALERIGITPAETPFGRLGQLEMYIKELNISNAAFNYILWHLDDEFESKESDKAWLLTWNTKGWAWPEYKSWSADTKAGITHSEPWTCSSKKPKIGDEIFLMKTGNEPRGIIAHGYISKEAYDAEHYDSDKASKGVKANHIDAEFDMILDYETDPIILQEDLKVKIPNQQWSPQSSGIEIKGPEFSELKKMWMELIGEKSAEEYWPSLEEYDSGITKDKWVELLNDPDITFIENLRMFKMMLELGGESTCSNLAEIYGGSAGSYNNWGRIFGERVHKKTNCPLCVDGDHQRFYTIPFVGRYVIENGKRRYSWKLRNELEEALKKMDLSHVDITKEEVSEIAYDKNMILYGPPGTGKTYNSAIYAVAICNNKSVEEIKMLDYSEIMNEYNALKNAGRIAFTTFHQSYGYEEFIEGIKPVVNEEESNLGYVIESGVFKKFCENAEIPEQEDVSFSGTIWNVRSRANDSDIDFDYEEYLYKYGVVIVEDIEDYKRQCNCLAKMAKGDLVVLGRDHRISAVGVVTDDEPQTVKIRQFNWRRNVRWIFYGKSFSFTDIGLPGKFFSNFAIAKSKIKISNLQRIINLSESTKPHVFIIDEINRGNISKIFGELITLIENTKRKGLDEAASAILPYSGESFSVPANVYILGTMNTADRSIALMDTALRRRFQFAEMMPDADVLRDIGADKVDDLDVAAMLEKINERITFLYDREHTIGHAFFTKLAKAPTLETLQSIFEKSVIPLLQEYFYEDYQKIQLVLGDNGKTDDMLKFIVDEEVEAKNIFKGNADDVIDLPEKKYRINKDAFANIESYKQIM